MCCTPSLSLLLRASFNIITISNDIQPVAISEQMRYSIRAFQQRSQGGRSVVVCPCMEHALVFLMVPPNLDLYFIKLNVNDTCILPRVLLMCPR